MATELDNALARIGRFIHFSFDQIDISGDIEVARQHQALSPELVHDLVNGSLERLSVDQIPHALSALEAIDFTGREDDVYTGIFEASYNHRGEAVKELPDALMRLQSERGTPPHLAKLFLAYLEKEGEQLNFDPEQRRVLTDILTDEADILGQETGERVKESLTSEVSRSLTLYNYIRAARFVGIYHHIFGNIDDISGMVGSAVDFCLGQRWLEPASEFLIATTGSADAVDVSQFKDLIAATRKEILGMNYGPRTKVKELADLADNIVYLEKTYGSRVGHCLKDEMKDAATRAMHTHDHRETLMFLQHLARLASIFPREDEESAPKPNELLPLDLRYGLRLAINRAEKHVNWMAGRRTNPIDHDLAYTLRSALDTCRKEYGINSLRAPIPKPELPWFMQRS